MPLAYALTIAAGITAITARVAMARNNPPVDLFMGDVPSQSVTKYQHHRQTVALIYSLDSKYVPLLIRSATRTRAESAHPNCQGLHISHHSTISAKKRGNGID
jgi:hypothetical protein